MVPISRMILEPEKSNEVFGTTSGPTASLAFEAPVDAHFDVLFDHTATACAPAQAGVRPNGAAASEQRASCRSVAVTQDVANERVIFGLIRSLIHCAAIRLSKRSPKM